MSNSKPQPFADQLGERVDAFNMVSMLCWFAAFPYSAYTQLSTPTLRAWILTRGVAVIVSPLVFTLALLSNGNLIVNTMTYLYLLPVVVIFIDRFLISTTYGHDKSSRWLWCVRILIFLISASMALFAGVLSERAKLLQTLHKTEDSVTLASFEAQNLIARRQAIDEQIARNETEIMSRSTVESELREARRLEMLECNGTAGIDRKTGMVIKGGKCGIRAANHRTNAEDAEAHLAGLDKLSEENHRLIEQRAKLNNNFNNLLKFNRKDSVNPSSPPKHVLKK